MTRNRLPILYAILAAVCYGSSAPIAKLLLEDVPPALMAALLYLGAGLGMLAVHGFSRTLTDRKEAQITKTERPYLAAMVVLDTAAPILLMVGLKQTSSATASLLNNFEIVATSVIALIIFKEAVGRRMWLAIALITTASILLSVDDINQLTFSVGSIYILLACVCWGIENNCTARLSLKDPLQIVVVKGVGSGLGALIIALVLGEYAARIWPMVAALLLGFAAYGLSVYLYIHAQRNLGATRTSAFYAITPFVGVGLSFIVFQETPALSFWIALTMMVVGAYFVAFEKHEHHHIHAQVEHEHRHNHHDKHHEHYHLPPVEGEHSHAHVHEVITHSHGHTPDLHHSHTH